MYQTKSRNGLRVVLLLRKAPTLVAGRVPDLDVPCSSVPLLLKSDDNCDEVVDAGGSGGREQIWAGEGGRERRRGRVAY